MPLKFAFIPDEAFRLYYPDEIDEVAKDEMDFDTNFVVVVFRASVNDQHFPLRVRIRRDEGPEDEIISRARVKAKEIIAALALEAAAT